MMMTTTTTDSSGRIYNAVTRIGHCLAAKVVFHSHFSPKNRKRVSLPHPQIKVGEQSTKYKELYGDMGWM